MTETTVVTATATASAAPSVLTAPAVALAVLPELRSGEWTRFGSTATLGDLPTERVLAGLAESTRTAARAQGYAVGWGEGRREAAAEAACEAAAAAQSAAAEQRRRESEHRAAVASLVTAADQLSALTRQTCSALADQAVELARELTEALVGRELRASQELGEDGADLVRRVLPILPRDARVCLRIMPGALGPAATTELAAHGVSIVADPGLAPGEAFLETDETAVDLGIASALQRVREVLS